VIHSLWASMPSISLYASTSSPLLPRIGTPSSSTSRGNPCRAHPPRASMVVPLLLPPRHRPRMELQGVGCYCCSAMTMTVRWHCSSFAATNVDGTTNIGHVGPMCVPHSTLSSGTGIQYLILSKSP
jgi:hypothetical protein